MEKNLVSDFFLLCFIRKDSVVERRRCIIVERTWVQIPVINFEETIIIELFEAYIKSWIQNCPQRRDMSWYL